MLFFLIRDSRNLYKNAKVKNRMILGPKKKSINNGIFGWQMRLCTNEK